MPEQSHPPGGAFLSYASQDAAAAARMCAALRAAGVAVWLDRSELRGGDAWDAQIKKQIHDCALFIPVISAHTNARTEGYFRREWKLATRRLLDMADDVPFLLPVVIDDTREADARVPEEFLRAQWTRLPDGATPPAFVHRVRELLGGDGAAVRTVQSARTGAHEPGARRPRSAQPWLWFGGRGRRRPGRVGLALIALLLALGGWAFWHHRAAQDAPAASAPAAAPAAAQGSPGASADERPSIAVLPFVALSSGPDDGYFADGLTEEIINALAALPDLLVTARTSAFYFKGREIPVPEIAATLGVAHIVEGSVRRSGDTARITAQLIRAADGFHLWSETYDQPLGDAFAVQTRIAESVATALGVLLDERRRGMMADIGVRDVEVFVAYQRGVELFNRAHNEGPLVPLLARANSEFEAAIARKPDLAYAHFQHADYFAHLLIDEAPGHGAEFVSETGLSIDEAARRLAADFDAAFRYERDAGQRFVVQAVRTTVSADWRNLGDQIAHALAAWETCRHGLWIDQTAIVFGYGEAALAHDLRRERCDPLGGNWTRTAITAVWIGRPMDGLKYADRIEALRGQDRDVMHARILAYLALGRLDEAEALFDAGSFGAADVSEAMSLLALQIPAAAGRIAEWEKLRPTLERDPGRLLVGAAVFGDRETANGAAAAIDAMTLGPAILLRVTDRCGCGTPFDLEAAPNFARLLRESGLPWSPPAPIEFPLKNW